MITTILSGWAVCWTSHVWLWLGAKNWLPEMFVIGCTCNRAIEPACHRAGGVAFSGGSGLLLIGWCGILMGIVATSVCFTVFSIIVIIFAGSGVRLLMIYAFCMVHRNDIAVVPTKCGNLWVVVGFANLNAHLGHGRGVGFYGSWWGSGVRGPGGGDIPMQPHCCRQPRLLWFMLLRPLVQHTHVISQHAS